MHNTFKRIVTVLKGILGNERGSFNFGVGRNGVAPTFAINSSFYNELLYRRWVTRIALDFYTGRQDTYVWYDLQKGFRNPEKQQIVPYNITQEIIDETSILYREEPNYLVKDKEGNVLETETKLWKQIRKTGRYHNLCQQLDSMTKLLGTVLVKVSFVDPMTGDLVNKNEPGMVQFDLVYGGYFNVKWSSSPYFMNEIDFEFSDDTKNSQNRYAFGAEIKPSNTLTVATVPTDTTRISERKVDNLSQLKTISKITWSIKDHKVEDEDGNTFEGENPYGVIPAVPFFNQDPGNRFFLPINEPLLYANHAINMRLSDLNHIAKYQSFGQAVVKGIERPVNNRFGRPVDDYNSAGGSRTFGLGQGANTGPTGLDRNFHSPFDYYSDGNATANKNGFSVGPDTIVSVGETGDFKFVSPNANIGGLTETIYTMMDMLRINHGLRPKHKGGTSGSGYNATLEKLGVVEKNKKRSLFFKEREQQLFEIVKKLWNVHHAESEEKTFSEDCELDIYYVEPEFAVDPQTKMAALKQEMEIIATGDKQAIRKIKPHLDDAALDELLKSYHTDMMSQMKRDVEIENYKFNNLDEVQAEIEVADAEMGLTTGAGGGSSDGTPDSPTGPKKNPAKHAKESSIQPGKNGDTRKTDASKRKQADKEVKKK